MTSDVIKQWAHRIDKPVECSQKYLKYLENGIDPIHKLTDDIWNKCKKYLLDNITESKGETNMNYSIVNELARANDVQLKVNGNAVPVRLNNVTVNDVRYCVSPEVTFSGVVLNQLDRDTKTALDNISRKTPTNKARTFPAIKKVIFNFPATIVFWGDGTKTVVKMQDCDIQNGELFDPEKGLALAIAKKALGNEGKYFNELKPWIESYYENEAQRESDIAKLSRFVGQFYGNYD